VAHEEQPLEGAASMLGADMVTPAGANEAIGVIGLIMPTCPHVPPHAEGAEAQGL